MNFITYITKTVLNKAPHKGRYGQIISNYFSLENVIFTENIAITNIKDLDISFVENNKENRLDIMFHLFYKDFLFAEIDIKLHNISQFNFIGNLERSSNIAESIKQLDAHFNTVFKFEFTNDNVIIQAKNDTIDFQLKTQFKKIDITADFVNTVSFIDSIVNKEKNNQLFYTICDTITDEQLIGISKANYGDGDEIALPELLSIRDNKSVPKELTYETREVLKLTRYFSTKKKEHQERLFACCTILLREDDIFRTMDYIEGFLTGVFLSAIALDYAYETRAFLYNLLVVQKLTIEDTFLIAYLILGCDLLLKDEKSCSETMIFLQQTNFLQGLCLDFGVSHTAKTIEESTLIMLKNTHFIKDKTLQKNLTNLFTETIRLCKEHYDITAIKALFERSFSKEQQEEYLYLLPELLTIEYLDREKHLLNKGLNSMQVKIITDSLSNAEFFLKYEHNIEMELKKNIFFDTWLKVYKK